MLTKIGGQIWLSDLPFFIKGINKNHLPTLLAPSIALGAFRVSAWLCRGPDSRLQPARPRLHPLSSGHLQAVSGPSPHQHPLLDTLLTPFLAGLRSFSRLLALPVGFPRHVNQESEASRHRRTPGRLTRPPTCLPHMSTHLSWVLSRRRTGVLHLLWVTRDTCCSAEQVLLLPQEDCLISREESGPFKLTGLWHCCVCDVFAFHIQQLRPAFQW